MKDILEGELMKRQQLQKDLVQISDWLLKAENEVAERTNGNTEITGEYIEVCHFQNLLLVIKPFYSTDHILYPLMFSGGIERHKLAKQRHSEHITEYVF